MNQDAAQAQLDQWLNLPGRDRRHLLIEGAPNTGKSEFAARVADRVPGAVLIDCPGLTADQVMLRILAAARGGAEPANDRRGHRRVRDDLKGRHLVVVLRNPQWAGTVATSSEPKRIARQLALLLSHTYSAELRMVVEWDPACVGPAPRRAMRISLPLDERPRAAPTTAAGPSQEAAVALRALAAAETALVPVSVWQLLTATLHPEGPALQPLDLVTELPELLKAEEAGEAGEAGEAQPGSQGPMVSFRFPGDRHSWRHRESLTSSDQRRIVQALVAAVQPAGPARPWSELGPVGDYAARTLPVHAALAAGLPEVLADAKLLANCRPTGLLEALPLAYPDGVPAGSIAADLRHLESQGVLPEAQGEWVAWLHQSALSSGRDRLADGLLSAGIELPWRTLWSRWRPPGVFGALAGEVGRVDELAAEGEPGELTVITTRDATVDKMSEPSYAYVRQPRSMSSGAALAPPTVVPASLEEAAWLDRTRLPTDRNLTFAQHGEEGWRVTTSGEAPQPLTLPPRSPVSVRQAIGDGDRWVLSGAGGVFAVAGGAPAASATPVWREGPLVRAHASAAQWPMPSAAAEASRGAVSRGWLEETFGPGTCHPLPAADLPEGIRDTVARRFLTEVGVPHLTGFLHLTTRDLAASGLPSVDWPARSQAAPVSGGPFYPLGDWMYSRLLLDGSNGRVLRDATGGLPDTFVGSSLPQFFAMVRLFDEFRRTMYPASSDRADAQQSLHSWCQAIDPAAREEVWELVLTGYTFEDGTWDLATYGPYGLV